MAVTTFISLLNSRKFLLSAVVVFLIPFIAFCFWNFPSADDYIIIAKRDQYHFLELQKRFYFTWTGRYFTTFISTAFSYTGFLHSHYYLHTLLLFFFTVLSWLFCLFQVNKLLLNNRLSITTLLLISLLLLVFEINVIPEPVSAFYWFSSAITYQVPLILLILLVGVFTRILLGDYKKNVLVATAVILVVLLNGCNEIITLFTLIASTGAIGYYYYNYKKILPYIVFLYAVNLLSAGLLLFGPGIINRASLIDHSPIFSIISIAFIKFIILNWYFLKEPLWWLSLLFICLQLKRSSFVLNLVLQFKLIPPGYLLLFYLLSGLFIYIPVLYTTNGSIPLRSENIICFLYSLLLPGIVSLSMNTKANEKALAGSILLKYPYLLFSFLIFCTPNMQKVTDSLLSGFLYSQIMEERLALFISAKQRKEHEITFYDYETAVIKKVKERYPLLNRQILKNIIVKPPPIICFENDLYGLEYIKEFYGVTKVNVVQN